ncbi:hypothetical protein MMC13_001745 [Lambiella insularis]|nr:hypothetical protein [Lambiella insularis]
MNVMEKSLSQARDNLNVAFLVYMKHVLKCSKQAIRAAQNELLKNATRVEGNILQAVASTSESLQDDIQSLAEQLKNVSTDSVQQTVARFTTAHHDLLEHLSTRLASIFALFTFHRSANAEVISSKPTTQPISGYWSQRKQEQRAGVTSFMAESLLGQSRIYWVYGKIGAGKTTLLRFLDDNIIPFEHMLPWAEEATVVRASCFFWNAGNKLQKSMTGLLRTLLTQLFEQTPDLVPRVVQPSKWQTARLTGTHVIDWTDSELKDCILEYILYAANSRRIFLLVDGLDEF